MLNEVLALDVKATHNFKNQGQKLQPQLNFDIDIPTLKKKKKLESISQNFGTETRSLDWELVKIKDNTKWHT